MGSRWTVGRPRAALIVWLCAWLVFGALPVGPGLVGVHLGVGAGSAVAATIERVVVLPPASNAVSAATSQLLGEFLRQEVEQDVRFQLVSIDPRPCGDPACAARVGRELGADRVLWSRVESTPAGLRLLVDASHVQSGRSLGAIEVSAKEEQELFLAAGNAAGRMLDALAADPRESSEGEPSGSSGGTSSASAGGSDSTLSAGGIDAALPTVVHAPVERAPVGVALEIEAEVRGQLGTRELYAMFQVGGSSRVRYTRLRATGERDGAVVYLSSIPSSALTSAGLRYYLRLTTSAGDEIARFPQSGWWSVETTGDPTATPTHGPRHESVVANGTPSRENGSAAGGADGNSTVGRGDRMNEGTPAGSSREESGTDMATGERPGGGGNKKWFLIGGAAAALGGVVALLAAGGGGDSSDPPDDQPTSLPLPPEH
ncbi:MAG: hypothetical protein R3E97_16430 [Candidatus Eisenbacteria bacterium]